MRSLPALPIVLLLCCAGAACETTRSAATPQPARVDSVVPRDEALRRFQSDLSAPANLQGGFASRESLVRAFVLALESRDTARLGGMVMDRAEFAFLYYLTNPQSLPPYDLSPALMWFVLTGESRKGLAHLLAERGGQSLKYVDHRCEPEATVQGENRIWEPCVVRRVQAAGDTVSERLFGPIIERGGRFKLVSFANRL